MKYYTILLLITVLTVFASISVRAETSGHETIRIGQASSQDRARDYLAREVRHELVMLPYYSVFDWLQFQTQSDGTVVLSGQVTRPTLKSDAENVVKKVEGVTNVVNRIEVLPLSPNDDRIRRAVYRSLFSGDSPLFRYGLGAVPSIHIIVRNGNVTLKGVVANQSDSNIANIRANSVSGVFSVRNELTVENSRRRS
jgi:osmotically-inducible protein OsmY